jgi:flagellar motility protein MotE (MotC chaperone)
MAQTSAEVSVSGSAAITTADLAANKLWEYQLRRENKVILQEIKEAAKRREANNAEAERKTNVLDERIAALEAKVAEFERMYKEDEKARAKWNEEAVALRSAMAGFLAGQVRAGSWTLQLPSVLAMLMFER